MKLDMARFADIAEFGICKTALIRSASFDDVLASKERALYAGKLRRSLPQYATHFGMTPFFPNRRNIDFDVSQRMPLPDNSIRVYQSEDVFEHLAINKIVPIFNDIHRVLMPGGLFRLCLPDYRFSGYRDRIRPDQASGILFDSAGGGRVVDGEIVDGGHLWFPDIDIVRQMFDESDFNDGDIQYLHYTEADGTSVTLDIDYSLGHVQRTPDHDSRSQSPRRAQSLVIDARKGQTA